MGSRPLKRIDASWLIKKSFAMGFMAACLMLDAGLARADCTVASPTGHFEGTAVSKELGKLDLTLDLRCSDRHYEGELVTPVGIYTVKNGAFVRGELELQLEAGADSVSVRAKLERVGLHGQFMSGEDSGPLALRRTGEAHVGHSMEALLHLTPQQWAQDVDFFARELPQRHANAFHHQTREQFDAAIADLKRRLPQMNGDQIYIALDRLANAIGDAHTYVEFPSDTAEFPLQLQKFGADYRVVAVGPGYEKALGSRLVKIADTSAEQASQRALSITPSTETVALADARIAGFLTKGIALHGLGIIPNRDVASYTFDNDAGGNLALAFHASPPGTEIQWIEFVKNSPLYLQNPDKKFWYTYLPESSTLYCNFRGYEELEKNAGGLLRELHDKNPEKLVIDVRQNRGGNYELGLKYLIEPIRALPQINQVGHLFVLIGASTFSAAMSNAAQFRKRTAAMLVGEPIGERPNSYQEARELRLPNSQLRVRYSTRYYRFTESAENIIRPDHEVLTDWKAYAAGRDPVLEWVLQYKSLGRSTTEKN